MRFASTGHGLISMVKEYISWKFLDSVLLTSSGRSSRGILILSPGIYYLLFISYLNFLLSAKRGVRLGSGNN